MSPLELILMQMRVGFAELGARIGQLSEGLATSLAPGPITEPAERSVNLEWVEARERGELFEFLLWKRSGGDDEERMAAGFVLQRLDEGLETGRGIGLATKFGLLNTDLETLHARASSPADPTGVRSPNPDARMEREMRQREFERSRKAEIREAGGQAPLDARHYPMAGGWGVRKIDPKQLA